jgi:hypothetical protein
MNARFHESNSAGTDLGFPASLSSIDADYIHELWQNSQIIFACHQIISPE